MSLSREQYDEIQRILNGRRSASIAKQQRKQEEVYGQLPALFVLDERAAEIGLEEAKARLSGDGNRSETLQRRRHALQQEKRELLQDAGYDADVLETVYTCSRCRDTGYIGNQKCGCRRQLESELLNRDAGLPRMLSEENFQTFDIDVFDDRTDLKELLPEHLTQRVYMAEEVLPKIKSYMEHFEEDGSHNLLLYGPPGTGKTFLINCIARWLIDRQHTVLYERADRMFAMLSREFFAREKDEAAREHIGRLSSTELLIIDDLGTEFLTEYTKSELFSIISDRLTRGLSTIISSNLSLKQMRGIYSERITSRFSMEYTMIPFLGPDIRTK